MKPKIEVNLEAVVTIAIRTGVLTVPEHLVQDEPRTIEDLKHANWFYEECCSLLDPFTDDGLWDDMAAEVTLTVPNPNYRGPDVMFGEPPPETIVVKGRVKW